MTTVNIKLEIFVSKMQVCIAKYQLKEKRSILKKLNEELEEIRRDINFRIQQMTGQEEVSTRNRDKALEKTHNEFPKVEAEVDLGSEKKHNHGLEYQHSGAESTEFKACSQSVSREAKVNDIEDRSIFVDGLNEKTDEQSLTKYLSNWGEVSDVYIAKHPCLRRYAFVTFSKLHGESPVSAPKKLMIDGSIVKLVKTSNKKCQSSLKTKCLKVCGNMQGLSTLDFTQHFSKYGVVIRFSRPMESEGFFKRFAFVLYKDFESVDRATTNVTQEVNGTILDVRRSTRHYY